jgi:hypothetical protein
MFKRTATAISLIVSIITLNLVVAAQAPQEKVDTQTIEKIKEEGLKRSQVMEIISYMTDVHGPRLSGSTGLKSAQEWARKKLEGWGLQNAKLEAWGQFGRGWTLDGFSIGMLKPYFSPMIGYPKAWSPSTKGAVRGEVVYFDVKTDADLEKYKGKLKGAIVLMSPSRDLKAHFEPEAVRMTDTDLLNMANAAPTGSGLQGRRFQMTEEQRAAMAMATKKWEMLYAEGASVVLEPSRIGDGGTLFVGGANLTYPSDTPANQRKNVRDKDAPAIIPQVVLTAEHYNQMIRIMQKGVPVQMEVNINAHYNDQDLNGYNVVAEIPGTDLKDEIVMLGGHYDSWHSSTGATDNATGSAVAMEAIRLIQTLGLKPRRTIRIALWSGEEQGLLGSRNYVTNHFAKRPGQNNFGPSSQGGPPSQSPSGPIETKPDYEKFSVYFNLDNGTGKIRGVYMQGNESARSIFRSWLAPFKDMGASTLTISNTGGTDHLAFDAVGLPGFQFIQDDVEYDTRTHHSNMDNYDRVQEDDMKQASIIMAAFVYHAAMRDQKFPRKPRPDQPAPQPER